MQNQTIWAHIVIFFYLEEFLKATKITLEIILQLVLEKIIFKICAVNEWFIQVWKHYNITMYFYMKAILFRQTVRFM